MDNIRTFIAVEVPQQIKMELDRLISELRPLAPEIRWVKAANLHLTLRFLGDIPKSAVPGLAEEIGNNVGGFGAFEISLAGVGGFPNLKKARVIWIGGGQGRERLYQLAPLVEQSCIARGLGAADKPFSSHLTIGRIKIPKGHERLISHIESLSFESPVFPVEEVAIFKSELFPSGPKYTRLEVVCL